MYILYLSSGDIHFVYQIRTTFYTVNYLAVNIFEKLYVSELKFEVKVSEYSLRIIVYDNGFKYIHGEGNNMKIIIITTKILTFCNFF